MTKHVLPKPLEQKLQETIQSAFRGYTYLTAVNVAIDLNSKANGEALDVIPVTKEYEEDICNCLYVAGEYSGSGNVVYRDIILNFI